MIYLRHPQLTDIFQCPYGKGLKACYKEFFAIDLSPNDLDVLLGDGWRKFGPYFFAPDCIECSACIPLRLEPSKIVLTKSQKRIYKKNTDLRIISGPLNFRSEIYNLYEGFQRERFDKTECDLEQFYQSFYLVSEYGLQIEYFNQETLIGVGFVDVTDTAMSSVYFFWKTQEYKRSLGIYSIMQEIKLCQEMNLKYYYLGHALEALHSMNYKFQFKPHELYSWELRKWRKV